MRSRAKRVLDTLALDTLAPTPILRRVEVLGHSMRPTLEPGDRLVVLPWLGIQPGDLVALSDPRAPSRTLVKRVTAVGPAGVEVSGDQPQASIDSRTFGPVPRRGIGGRVVYRYAPADRIRVWRRGQLGLS